MPKEHFDAEAAGGDGSGCIADAWWCFDLNDNKNSLRLIPVSSQGMAPEMQLPNSCFQ